VLTVQTVRQAAARTWAVTLAQALPKGPSMDAIVRKATEIGAAHIIPLETARTQVHLDADRSDKKIEKWQIAALEAAKQCGNPWLPKIAPVTKLERLLGDCGAYELVLVASLQAGAQGFKAVLAAWMKAHGQGPRSVLWLVGPEGDFTAEEMEAVLAAGAVPVTLGPLVLRCETAAIYALSVLSYELGA
jgi:16S rRNA (uracil1498-N3)-methyltransferase